MKNLYKISEWDLMMCFTRNNISFHSTGTIDKEINGKTVKLYDYYECDSITDSQKESILKEYPQVKFFISQSEYAPEKKEE